MSTATAWLREPAGERALALPFSVGSTADDAVRVPGAGPDEALQLDWRDGLLWASPARGASLSLNGELLAAGTARELRDGDVIAVGAARVRLGRAAVPGGDADAVASLDILHMAGNETLAPLHAARVRTGAEDGEDADLVVAAIDFPGADATGVAAAASSAVFRSCERLITYWRIASTSSGANRPANDGMPRSALAPATMPAKIACLSGVR